MNTAAIERNRCPLTDEEVDRLGTYFSYHQFHDRIGITFEQFVKKVRNNTWELNFQ